MNNVVIVNPDCISQYCIAILKNSISGTHNGAPIEYDGTQTTINGQAAYLTDVYLTDVINCPPT